MVVVVEVLVVVEVVVVVVVVPDGRSLITAVFIIAVAVSTITALEVAVLLEVDIPAGSLVLGNTVLHNPPVCGDLGTHPALSRPSFITKLVPPLIDPAVVRLGVTKSHHKEKIVTNWIVSFG